jgi:hypothetical protein
VHKGSTETSQLALNTKEPNLASAAGLSDLFCLSSCLEMKSWGAFSEKSCEVIGDPDDTEINI